jgi:hypothetical protein
MIEYKARKETSLLPAWVREYQRLEEGPLSIHEQQTNHLWERISHLEEKLNAQALDFEASYFALEKDMAELQGKYNEKKHIKRRDGTRGKRKPSSFDLNGRKRTKIGNAEDGEPSYDNGEEDEAELDETTQIVLTQHQGERFEVIQGHGPAVAPTTVVQYPHPETYTPYYQERIRYAGGWHGTGLRRYF